MKTRALFAIAAIVFVLIGIAYGGIYYFYSEYTKKVAALEDENRSLKSQITRVKEDVTKTNGIIDQLGVNLSNYESSLASLESKITTQSQDVQTLKATLDGWQKDIDDLKQKLSGVTLEEVDLGAVAVERKK